MGNEVTTIDPEKYELSAERASSIGEAFVPMVAEREQLRKEYLEIIAVEEITPDLAKDAKALKNKLVKVRTGIAKQHKAQKHLFLQGGRFVDALKNAETLPVEQMEEKLAEIYEYYENLEKERIAKLKAERMAMAEPLDSNAKFMKVEEMTEEAWESYYANIVLADKARRDAESKAEADRIAAEKKAEEERIAKEKAEAEERKRIEEENARLKAEAEAREKAEKERLAKEQAEEIKRLAKQKAEDEEKARIQLENDKLKEQARSKEEAERKAKEDQAKREADKKHRAKVQSDIEDAIILLINELRPTLEGDSPLIAEELVTAILSDKIPNVSIQY